MKRCFKCGRELPLSQFYKHKQMADGHLNKCKDCTKTDVTSNRNANIERYRAYDRARGNRQPDSYMREYREKYPNKARAHRKVAYATQCGDLIAKPCEQCGEIKTHAHHDDYEKALEVRWLCAACHRQWHIENGEAANP